MRMKDPTVRVVEGKGRRRDGESGKKKGRANDEWQGIGGRQELGFGE